MTDLILSQAPRSPALVYLAGLDSEHSRRAMRGGLERILRALRIEAPYATFAWERMDHADVTAARAAVVRDYKPAAANQSLCALRGVFRAAFELGLVTGETYARVRALRGVRANRLPAGRDLPPEDLQRLFAACDRSDPVGVRDAALLAVLRVTGMRRHEVAKIQLEDLDRAQGTAKVVGKRNKERLCHLGEALVEVEAWLEVRGEEPGPLFHPWSVKAQEFRNRALTANGVYDILKRIGKRAGVELSPHDTRRTAAGDLLDQNVDLVTVQKILGHEDPKTTARYDRRPERTRAKAAAKLKVPR